MGWPKWAEFPVVGSVWFPHYGPLDGRHPEGPRFHQRARGISRLGFSFKIKLTCLASAPALEFSGSKAAVNRAFSLFFPGKSDLGNGSASSAALALCEAVVLCNSESALQQEGPFCPKPPRSSEPEIERILLRGNTDSGNTHGPLCLLLRIVFQTCLRRWLLRRQSHLRVRAQVRQPQPLPQRESQLTICSRRC
jgi:hypothetical protein